MLSDPIADTLTRIRNAYKRGLLNVELHHTNMNVGLLEALKQYGFIEDIKVFKHENSTLKGINVTLKYMDRTPSISYIGRVSKPGLRRYVKAKDIQKVIGGLGIYVISTPRGVMASPEARKKKLGGEIICKVY